MTFMTNYIILIYFLGYHKDLPSQRKDKEEDTPYFTKHFFNLRDRCESCDHHRRT